MSGAKGWLLIGGALGMATLLAAPLAIVLLLSSAGGVVPGGGCLGDGGTGGGSQQVGDRTWSAEQTANAQTITQVTIDRGLPRRAAVIAVATAIVESELKNVEFGHADSLGLFQQRESQGWGPPSVTLNPVLATGRFLDGLVALPEPGWETLPLGVAAQAVQRSAFPDRYAPQEPAAAELVSRFWVGPDVPAPSTGGAVAGQTVALSTTACPDQGESNLPVGPAGLSREQLPAGFALPADPAQRAAVSFAVAQLSKPYVFGAKGPAAFDCSGLMQAAWAAAGVAISAGTSGQVHDGVPVGALEQVAPGDLLFIPGSLGTAQAPRHVGMYVGEGVVVSAHSTKAGIILAGLDEWQDEIVAIRRIGPPADTAAAPPLAAQLGGGTR